MKILKRFCDRRATRAMLRKQTYCCLTSSNTWKRYFHFLWRSWVFHRSVTIVLSFSVSHKTRSFQGFGKEEDNGEQQEEMGTDLQNCQCLKLCKVSNNEKNLGKNTVMNGTETLVSRIVFSLLRRFSLACIFPSCLKIILCLFWTKLTAFRQKTGQTWALSLLLNTVLGLLV